MRPDLRLIPPAVSLWVAAALTIGAPDAARPLAVACWILAAGALLVAVLVGRARATARRRPPRARTNHRAALLATLCSVSFASVALVTSVVATQAQTRTPPILTDGADRQRVTMTVRVDSTPHHISPGFDGAERARWRGTAQSVLLPSPTPTPISAPVTVIAPLPPSAPPPPFGALVRVTGTLTANAPGEPTAFTLSATAPATPLDDPPWWLAWTEQVRHRFAAASAITPGNGGALLPGLAIGDETAVPADLDTAMKAASLSHLTAVSGANCAMITAVAFFVSARLGLGRRTRVLVALLALAAFVILVTPGGSVIRASTMAVVVLVGIARGRPSQGLPLLALAVIVLLVHDPWLARDYGFALSVLATGGLMLLAGPLARILSRWLPQTLAVALAVPVAAQLACQPVLILLSPTLPLYGVAANLLAAPAAPVATLLGCLACVALPFLPALGQALVWAAWAPSAWIAQVATATSALPGSALPWADGIVGVLLCAAALVAVTVLALARPRVGRGMLATVATASLFLGTVGYLGILGGTVIGRAVALPDTWRLAACDVGQGDALLIRDGDHVAMIDVGREPALATACLDTLGIAHIHLLILTHFDVDHVGGLPAVLGRVERALVGEPGRELDTRALDSLRESGATVEQVVAGAHGTLGAATWTVLWPPQPPPGTPALAGNPGSITVALDGHGMRSIFLGDLGETSQDALLATGDFRPVDVVKVAHHGSADQSPRLYSALNASLALVSVGADNGYGHPTRSALGMLAATGSTVARTDHSGLLLVSPGPVPGRVDLWTERDLPPATPDALASPVAVSTSSRAERDPPPASTVPPSAPAPGDGGRPYTGIDRGGTWRHEAAAGRARARGGRRAPSSRSSRGTRSGRRRWCWCPVRRGSSPTGPSGCCATLSRPRTRVSRSATSTRRTTRRGSCLLLRAPPCSVSPD
ncbi:MBL fold metallo-hydrolase [Leifsonia sp. PS1209]|nr:MBL fold metallo-hydrolase [Leifsonia sp. PS1209]